MKYFILFILCLNLFCVNEAVAQSITWERIYNGLGNNIDGFRSICKADGDNMYVVGYSWISGTQKRMYVVKLNKYGDTIWTRILGDNSFGGPNAYAVTPSGDGGCVLTGGWWEAFTIKISSNGEIIWQKFYGGAAIQLYDIKKTPDGGYIACGRYDDANFNGIVVKIDPTGELQWSKTYPAQFIRTFASVEISGDSGYMLVGNIMETPQSNGNGFITKMNKSGDTLWNRKFSIDTITSTEKMYKISDGYVIGGNIRHRVILDYTRMYFYKVDFNGDSIFANIIKSPKDEYMYDIKVINENKYVLAGYIDSATANVLNGRIWVTDALGNILKEKILPSPDYIVLYSILPQTNSDIVIAGEADLNINPYNDAYAVRLDSNLNYSPIGIIENHNIIPDKFVLYQNYPNPFNPKTTIKYDIPVGTHHGVFVQLKIYDITGREILSITEFKQAGSYSYTFDGTNYASGIYIYKLETDNFVSTKKMVLLK